jgi:hypothetical protein
MQISSIDQTFWPMHVVLGSGGGCDFVKDILQIFTKQFIVYFRQEPSF